MALKYDVIGKINFGSEVNDILKLNGIKDIEGFKNPSEDNIEDLDCLDNIEVASRIIIDGIENKKTIGILVDCDADGYTSASVIYDYITRISNKTNIPKVFIHNGKQHGLSDKEVFKLAQDIFDDIQSIDVEELSSEYKKVFSKIKKSILSILELGN